jgi:hypothetical protein
VVNIPTVATAVITIPSAAVYKAHYAFYAVSGTFNTTATARCRQHTTAGKPPLAGNTLLPTNHRRRQTTAVRKPPLPATPALPTMPPLPAT